jgi:hypothetical protein
MRGEAAGVGGSAASGELGELGEDLGELKLVGFVEMSGT